MDGLKIAFNLPSLEKAPADTQQPAASAAAWRRVVRDDLEKGSGESTGASGFTDSSSASMQRHEQS